MENFLLVSGILGPFLIVWGLAVMFYPPRAQRMIEEITTSVSLPALFGMVLFLLGLFLVQTFNQWDTPSHIVVSLVSWLTLFKGFCFLLFPKVVAATRRPFFKKSNRWILILSGIIVTALGVYISLPGYL